MRIRKLCKAYEVAGQKVEVLNNLNLDVDDHGITVVLGHSGCGKTTLLRLVAGLEKADSGTVETDGKLGTDDGPGTKERPEGRGMRKMSNNRRKMGVIFQEPRLMPWLTVGDNILFGTGRKMRRRAPQDDSLVRLLRLTKLEGFEKAYPSQLSGGMQQRAALARALAYEPDYLLMDEPFAALDYFTRKKMQEELLKIHETEGKGILFVTHSIDEALTIGRRVVILEQGRSGMEYGLEDISYPRDLLTKELSEMKRDIEKHITLKGGNQNEV